MKKEIRIGLTAQKVLLLLFGGIALGLSGSPKAYFRILKNINKEWEQINNRALHYAIKKLYISKLIDIKENPDGAITIVINQKGKTQALTYKVDQIQIKPMKEWDKKWRIILFDIPERFKKARDAFSYSLKQLGFYRLQKSVFIHPFECEDEIEFIIEFWNLRPYVRIVITQQIDNELHLKKLFNLK